MKDKEIRDILIAYLTAEKTCRIYCEKNIGGAICDVMQVSDKLIGYEIKSDVDNYQRLTKQVEYYDKFFEENYLVVGEKHKQSARDKIPNYWGVIFICEDRIEVLRRAKKNRKFSMRKQLDLLWKNELKNILVRNNMPLYAQKSKAYLGDKIFEYVPEKKLKAQITEELSNRDYSVYTVPDEEITCIPVNEITDALSEENLDEITLDKWIEVYRNAHRIKREKEHMFMQKETYQEEYSVKFDQITTSLGVPWISKEIVNDFVNYILFGNEDKCRDIVQYEKITGSWRIKDKHRFKNSNINGKFGTMKHNALYIIELMLNLREIKFYDKNGKIDRAETLAALSKRDKLEDEFKTWLRKSEDRIRQIESMYNRMFAGFEARKYDGSNLMFPEMNPDFTLFDYQKDAVQRIISTPNTLLAFDVGAGKTYIMIAAAMKMREMGLSRKNMFVVPNNIVGQWEKIFENLYPKAKVLVIEPQSFMPKMRQKVLYQAQNGDYDGIIVAYSCFEQIPLSVEYLIADMNEKLGEIRNRITECVWDKNKLQRKMKSIKELTNELIKSAEHKCESITFDSLEVDTIFIDEAHNFKNVPIETKLKNLRGINTKGSKVCMDMLKKVRCVQNSNQGRGAILATGTPLCNSISDVYTMQLFLQYEDLKERNLDKFDNWVKTFARVEQNYEIDVTASGFRSVRRFTKFFNLAELALMFSKVACFYSVEDCIPDATELKNLIAKKSVALDKYMGNICRRAEEIRSGKINPKYDNMLKISMDGRKAALDLSLVGVRQEYDKCSKVAMCAQEIVRIHNAYPRCAQLVFCDISTPKGDGFCVYEKLKLLLIESGINEVAFIHDYNSEIAKLKLYDEVNKGNIRVLIGSTFKLGIGANVQGRLKAVHHLDVPWRPADMTQREGRMLRRGNLNKEVIICRYITEGSFDAYSWQILENKQRFISQFLSGSTNVRSIDDLERSVLTYAEVKMIAIGSPIEKLIEEKKNEIRRLQILCNKYIDDKKKLKEDIKILEKEIKITRARYEATIKNRVYLRKISNEQYLQTIREMPQILNAENIKNYQNGDRITVFLKFDIIANCRDDKVIVTLKRAGAGYELEMGETHSVNLKRIVNFMKSFDKTMRKEKELLEKLNKELHDVKKMIAMPDETADLLKNCKTELEELYEIAGNNFVQSLMVER